MKALRRLTGTLVIGLIMVALAANSQAAIWQVDPSGTGDFTTIQAAIDFAAPGDAISISAGHFIEQLTITKDNLSFSGAGQPATFIEAPVQLLEYFILGSYYFPVVMVENCDGVNFTDLTLDGLTHGDSNPLFQGFGFFNAGGDLNNINITGVRSSVLNAMPHGNGVFVVSVDGAPHAFNMTDVLVDDFQKSGVVVDGMNLTGTLSQVTITGQGITGAIAQNGIQVSRGAAFTLADCTVSDLSYTGTIWAATGYLGTTGTNVTMTRCFAEGCQTSVYMEDNSASFTDGAVTNPTGDALVVASSGAKALVERRVPQPVEIPFGKSGFEKSAGNMTVTNSVFTGNDTPDSWGPAAIAAGLVTFNMTDCQVSHFERGFVIVEDGGTVNGMARGCSFVDNISLGGWSNSFIDYDARQNWWGHISGPYHPVKNPGGLGSEVTDHILFDTWTQIGPGIVATVDGVNPIRCGLPKLVTVTYLGDPGGSVVQGYSVTLRITGPGTATASDVVDAGAMGNLGAHLFQVLENGDGTITVDDALMGLTTGLVNTADMFTIAVQTSCDGEVGVEFVSYELRDATNQPLYVPLLGTSFIVDCLAPAPVTNITATPGHNKIEVAWNHDDTDVDHYEIFRGLWYDTTPGVSAYPEYNDLPGNLIPIRPATWAEADASSQWAFVGTTPVGTHTIIDTWSDATSRGVYYYEVFAVDAVLNGDAAAANDRATNYWLGDVDHMDGLVDVADMTLLGASFGTTETSGTPPYNNSLDVGPTDDWSSFGIPLTDNTINFEDLMIFSLNFGVVSPAKVKIPGNEGANIRWVRRDEGSMALVLTGGSGLKGIRLEALIAVVRVLPGSLLKQQEGTYFLRNVGGNLDANLALLGSGKTFSGTGELLVVETDETISLDDLHLTARGVANQNLKVGTNSSSEPVVPAVFNLGTNYPNPFNPTTTISFSLPETQQVKLAIYSVDGRRVATLVDAIRGPGRYEEVWTGQDDRGRAVATGTYFYRLDAGPYCKVHKMTLIK